MIKITDDPTMYAKGGDDKAILIIHGFTGSFKESDIMFKYFNKKGYTVVRPLLSGHDGDKKKLNEQNPEDWIIEIEEAINQSIPSIKNIFIIGVSFGGNLGITLCVKHKEIIKGLVLIETPVLFGKKIKFVLDVIYPAAMPILDYFKIDTIKKNRILYRSKYKADKESVNNFLPLKAIGKIKNYINNKTKKELKVIKQPCLIMGASKSDLLDKKNCDYIFKNISSVNKKIIVEPIDNHDLDLLDEPKKILMFKEINTFLENIK